MARVEITRFFRSFLLRFDSDIWDSTQIWLRYLDQKTAVGASARIILTTKVRKSTQFLDESSSGGNFYSTCHLIVSRWHSFVARWFTLLYSLLTLWMCTKSQKDGQNHKNTGVRRAFFHKCPSRRANPSLDGRLSNTAKILKVPFS